MAYSHTKSGFASDTGFAIGLKGSEIQVIDQYGKVNYSSIGRGTAFYVDGNAGNNNNDGLTWGTAVKTVAAGIALVDDDIAKTNHWDRRNLLFINGGAYTEDLVRFPEKTDIIGVGNTDFLAKAKIIGVQKPATAVMGCRWINIAFQNATAAVTVDLIASNHGAAFIDCDFLGSASTTKALEINDCAHVTVQRCNFMGTTYGLKQLIGIQVSGVATNNNLMILDNYINCAVGIIIDDTDVVDGIIARNYLDVTTLAIDENADRLLVVDNRWISAAVLASSYDLAVTKCVGNIATGSDDTKAVPDQA